MKQREKLDSRRQPGNEFIEAQQRLVGAARLAEGLQQRWRQFGQPFARLGGLCRPIAAEMPRTDHPANVAGTFEAKAGQGLQGVGIVDIADVRNKAEALEGRFGVREGVVTASAGVGLWMVLAAGVLLLVAGLLADYVSYPAAFAVGAGLMIIAAALSWRMPHSRPRPAKGEVVDRATVD